MGDGLKKILIDLAGIAGKGELHEAIRSALSLPEYYGANLDALHDMLTEFGEGMDIVLSGAEKLDDSLSGYFEVMKEVFRDAEQEVRDFVVEFLDPDDAPAADDRHGDTAAAGSPLVSFRGGWTRQGNVVKAMRDRERHVSGGRCWRRRHG